MKKLLFTLTSALLVLSLAACAAKPAVPESTAAAAEESSSETAVVETVAPTAAETEEAPGAAQASAGMVNPMVPVDDPAYFKKELDIQIDTAQLPAKPELFIIASKLADCQFQIDSSIEGKVDCDFRATRDEETAASMSGLFYELSSMDEIEIYTTDGDWFPVNHEISADGQITLYSFNYHDTWYTLCLQGNPSYGDNRNVLYSVLAAAGIEMDEEAMEESWYETSSDDTILTVHLPANATTGYQWFYKFWDDKSLELITEEYVPEKHPEGMAGYGGTWHASFRVIGDYECSNYISFMYARAGADEIPSKVLDLEIGGGAMTITGVHEPDFAAYPSEDGEFDNVDIYFANMIEENELSFYGIVDVSMDKHITVHFTNETKVTDEIEEELKTGNSGTIYDKLRDYLNVKAKVTVKDGVATALTIYR